MICQQRFLHYWAANALSVADMILIRQVVASVNGFIGPEPGRSFGAAIQSNKKRPKSHTNPRK